MMFEREEKRREKWGKTFSLFIESQIHKNEEGKKISNSLLEFPTFEAVNKLHSGGYEKKESWMGAKNC